MTRRFSARTSAAIAFVVLVTASAGAQPAVKATAGPAPAASALVADGIARARADNKLVMVEFSASWCGFCHQYERFLADTVAGVGQIMRDNFVIVQVIVQEGGAKAVLNNPGSDSLLSAYANREGSGIPFYAILDGSGKILGTSNAMPDGSNIGHPVNEVEYEAFDKLLMKTAPKITMQQRDRIRTYLRGMQIRK